MTKPNPFSETADGFTGNDGLAKHIVSKSRRYMVSRPISVSKEKLYQWYVVEGLSTHQIAKRLGCWGTTIGDWLKRFGIPRRNPKAKQIFSRELLDELYTEKKLSAAQIAKMTGSTSTTILNRLIEFNITRRSIRRNLPIEKAVNFYCSQKKSLKWIADEFDCSVSAVQRLLEKNEVKIRAHWEMNVKHEKFDFSEDLVEKAYLIGFRLGDMNCARTSKRLIQVKSNTTKQAQLELMKSLFEKYGPCYIGVDKKAVFNFSSSLNNSFTFLIPKEDLIEGWILQNEPAFWAFFAGYTDAEGCIKIYDNRAKFRISTYDKNILLQLREQLVSFGINVRFYLNSPKQPGHNQDCWNITINEKSSLLKVLNMLQPHIKHANRFNDLLKAKENILMRSDVIGEKILC